MSVPASRAHWRCQVGMHRWTRYKDPKGELRTYDGTWTVKCRDCGRQRVVSSVPLIVVTVVAIVAGLVIAFTVGSLLGAALIIAGVGGLGVAMMPGLLERFASWLGGETRRRW